MSMTMNGTPQRRSRWIPWLFVGGMALVVVVNGVLIYSAVTTFTGVTTSHAYDRGRAYNQVLAEAARQDALGWRAEVTLANGAIAVQVRDPAAGAVAGQLAGVLRRPLEGVNLPLEFVGTGPGQWVAVPQGLRAGQWEARLSLTAPGGEVLDIRQRVVVP